MVRSPARDIERLKIDSGAIESVGYSEDRETLAIEFKSGHVFHYAGVSLATFEAFAQAESKGKFYAHNVRGKLASTCMTGKCPACGAIGYVAEVCSTCESGATVREIDRVHKP